MTVFSLVEVKDTGVNRVFATYITAWQGPSARDDDATGGGAGLPVLRDQEILVWRFRAFAGFVCSISRISRLQAGTWGWGSAIFHIDVHTLMCTQSSTSTARKLLKFELKTFLASLQTPKACPSLSYA